MRLLTLNALDTHDTGRFASHAAPGTLPVAVGMPMTLPGLPLVWAGDEFGLEGEDGEHSRTPIPWDDVDAAAPTIDLYAALIRMRLAHPALTEGGLRWLHVAEDVIVFVREHPRDRCWSQPHGRGSMSSSTSTPCNGKAELLFGDGELQGRTRAAGTARRSRAWSLPGVKLPQFSTG